VWSFDVKRFFQILVSAPVTFARAPRAARVGMVLFFAAAVADGILMPFFALWAHKDAGIRIEYIGLLLGCYAGGEPLATPFVGGIADKVGRRPVLLVSTYGVGFGFLLLYLVHGAAAVAAALIIIGVFESVLHPTASTVIADVVPAETRREHFAARRVMSNAGSMGDRHSALCARRRTAVGERCRHIAWRCARPGGRGAAARQRLKHRKEFFDDPNLRPAAANDSSGNGYPLADRRRGAIESRPHSCSASSQAISSRRANKVKCSDAAICASCAVIVEI
jgi:hypothetical protein